MHPSDKPVPPFHQVTPSINRFIRQIELPNPDGSSSPCLVEFEGPLGLIAAIAAQSEQTAQEPETVLVEASDAYDRKPLEEYYRLFGPKTVFIPVGLGSKKPKHAGWQKTTFQQTQAAQFRAELRGGNLGLVLGESSDNLVDLDCDTVEAVEEFLRDNPWASDTLQTRGARGRHFFLRIKGDYPQKVIRIFHAGSQNEQIGEWRGGNGSQTVIAGLHESGCNYLILNDKPVLEVTLEQFKRPAQWKAVWDTPPSRPWGPDWDTTSRDGEQAKEYGPPDQLLHRRIAGYMARVEPSIAGEHGDDQLWRVALKLIVGWGLSQAEALPYMEAFNARCEPPWGEYRLHYKLEEADEHGQGVRGRLRDDGAEAKEERAAAFSSAIIKGEKLFDIKLPPKKMIIDVWFKEGDLGFIFAYRGAGKTWLTLDLCGAIAGGGKCGPWQVNDKWPVLYIDGEMSHDDDKSRLSGLHDPIPENLYVLNHEVLFHYHKLVMNFGNAADQGIITQICLGKGIKVLVLDNLGCLVSGVEENKADEWEKMLPWLLELRRLGISVIIVHHSGHDSTRMRGTIKREDSAAWVLRLDDQRQDYSEAGAHFISRFRKLRGNKPEPDYEWRYEPSGDSGVLVTFKEASRADVVVQWVQDGLVSCSAIAREIGVSEGTISKLATKLIKEGRLIKNGRDYAIPDMETR